MAMSRIALLPSAPERDSDKSVIDVAEEVRKVVVVHGKTLLRVQLFMVLPCTFVLMLSDFFFQKFVNSFMPVPHPRPLADTNSLVTFGRLFPPMQMFRHVLLSFQSLQVFLTLAVAIAVGCLNLVLSVHYIAANVYATVLFHKGKSLVFSEVIQVSMKLRGRLVLTGFWGYLFTFAALLPLLLYDFMSWAKFPDWIFLVFGVFVAAVSFVVTFYISPIYQVANCIACCEENTGLPAFVTSSKIFDRKMLLRACFPVELFLRGLGSGAYSALVGVHMGPLSYVIWTATEFVLSSLIAQLGVVCWTFVYVWMKEYHDQTVDIISVPELQFRGAFQRVGVGMMNADGRDVEIANLADG